MTFTLFRPRLIWAGLVTLASASAPALEGVSPLEDILFKKNLGYQAQINHSQAQEALTSASRASFYPTISAVGGWGQNKTDELTAMQKGYLGFIEGRVNLFRGFKDHAVVQQRELDQTIEQLELEIQKKGLRLQLSEVVSDMIYLHQLQDILKEELKATLTQREMAAKKVSAGLTGPVDHLELDLRESEIQIEILQIDQAHLENHQKLKQLFGEDVSDSALAPVKLSPISTLTEKRLLPKSGSTLSEKKSELLRQKSELAKIETRADFLPSIDFTTSFGRLTPSEDSPIKFNETKYALLLTVPLFSGFETHYRSKASNHELSAAEKYKAQSQANTEADLSILVNKIAETSSLYAINEHKTATAQKYFDYTLAEYRRGIKNSPDLVTATDRLFSSKKKKIELQKELEILNAKFETLF